MSQDETLSEALEHIQQEWGLSDPQMAAFAHASLETYLGWKAKGRHETASVPPGMETAVPVVSIYKSLVRRFSDTEAQIQWLFKENDDFGGNKPIDIAASSTENLFWMSYYLDSKRE